jgi:hypothetical protein
LKLLAQGLGRSLYSGVRRRACTLQYGERCSALGQAIRERIEELRRAGSTRPSRRHPARRSWHVTSGESRGFGKCRTKKTQGVCLTLHALQKSSSVQRGGARQPGISDMTASKFTHDEFDYRVCDVGRKHCTRKHTACDFRASSLLAHRRPRTHNQDEHCNAHTQRHTSCYIGDCTMCAVECSGGWHTSIGFHNTFATHSYKTSPYYYVVLR